MAKPPTSLTGAAGEHFVAYRLTRMGHLAALAPDGAPNADLLASSVEGSKAVLICASTRRSRAPPFKLMVD